ncbi:MAG: hypothetical protein COX66_11985, partial [Elusimicrobia bacterium CG_4_10_14_0_2_um_filter_63_34]
RFWVSCGLPTAFLSRLGRDCVALRAPSSRFSLARKHANSNGNGASFPCDLAFEKRRYFFKFPGFLPSKASDARERPLRLAVPVSGSEESRSDSCEHRARGAKQSAFWKSPRFLLILNPEATT